jgi:zinc transport system substrate-binding protein
MKIKTLFISLVFALLAATAGVRFFLSRTASAPDSGARVKVVATLFPLYDMASAIGAGKAEVSLLLPPGVEAHSFEPKPGDMARIDRADIFIYAGALMEPWAEDLIRAASNKKLLAVNAGQGIGLARGAGKDSAQDPHIWLDFDNARAMARSIAAALEIKDPANGAAYRQAAAAYDGRLAALDAAYKTGLAACRTRDLVYGGHYAFGYAARRYGLKYFAAQGLSPDAEPTARDLAALVEQIRKDKIKFVFYEELASPRIAEAVAGETGAGMLMLSAAHNVSKDQLRLGVSFFDILESNLVNLREGLECR